MRSGSIPGSFTFQMAKFKLTWGRPAPPFPSFIRKNICLTRNRMVMLWCAFIIVRSTSYSGRKSQMSAESRIDELERLLNSEEDTPIQILPNGEIKEVGRATVAEMGTKKPLTMRENLGGEY